MTLIRSSSELLVVISKQRCHGDIGDDVEQMIDSLVGCALTFKYQIPPDAEFYRTFEEVQVVVERLISSYNLGTGYLLQPSDRAIISEYNRRIEDAAQLFGVRTPSIIY